MAQTFTDCNNAARRDYERDAWWRSILTFLAWSSSSTRPGRVQGNHYESSYLRPSIRAPFGEGSHSWSAVRDRLAAGALPFSPHGSFGRLAASGSPATYGAYYKAFWADPPSCSVGEPRKSYRGENSFPLILQNVHRYFLYLALAFLFVLAWDVWKAVWFTDPATGQQSFGIGVGTIVLAVNVVLLSSYTLGCHSFRHLVGGRLDQFSRHPTQTKVYDVACRLNCHHMQWAYASLFSVALADLYVRLCSMGILTDWKIL